MSAAHAPEALCRRSLRRSYAAQIRRAPSRSQQTHAFSSPTLVRTVLHEVPGCHNDTAPTQRRQAYAPEP